jgi:hypothetical protein
MLYASAGKLLTLTPVPAPLSFVFDFKLPEKEVLRLSEPP